MANASFTTPRVLNGAENQPSAPQFASSHVKYLIEPTAQSFRWHPDPDPNWKPAFGLANGLLWGSHDAARPYMKGCGESDWICRSRKSRPVISILPSSVNCR